MLGAFLYLEIVDVFQIISNYLAVYNSIDLNMRNPQKNLLPNNEEDHGKKQMKASKRLEARKKIVKRLFRQRIYARHMSRPICFAFNYEEDSFQDMGNGLY